MNTPFLLSFLFYFVFPLATAQSSSSLDNIPSAATSSVSLTPAMASSVLWQALATGTPQQPGDPSAGDAGSSPGSGDSQAGAAGVDNGSISISRGGIIAIIVVAVSVCVFGAVSAVLFYLAKKRSWKIRESIRKSARRVATALTPRRTTFPKDVHKSRSNRGLTKIEEVPSPKRNRSTDVEKGNPKLMAFEMTEPSSKQSRWARKIGR